MIYLLTVAVNRLPYTWGWSKNKNTFSSETPIKKKKKSGYLWKSVNGGQCYGFSIQERFRTNLSRWAVAN